MFINEGEQVDTKQDSDVQESFMMVQRPSRKGFSIDNSESMVYQPSQDTGFSKNSKLQKILNQIHLGGGQTRQHKGISDRNSSCFYGPLSTTINSPKSDYNQMGSAATNGRLPKSSLSTLQRRGFLESNSGAFSPVGVSSLAMSIKERKSILISNPRVEPAITLRENHKLIDALAQNALYNQSRYKNRSNSFIPHWNRNDGQINFTTQPNANINIVSDHLRNTAITRSELSRPQFEKTNRGNQDFSSVVASPKSMGHS